VQHVKNFAMFVQKSGVYWKAHKKTVNAVAGQNMKGTSHGQTAKAHESLEALCETSRFGDFLCHNAVASFVDGAQVHFLC